MKTTYITIILLTLVSGGVASNMFMVEDNTIYDPTEEDTVYMGEEVVAEVSFNLEKGAFCTILTAGGPIYGSSVHYLIIDMDTVLRSGDSRLGDLSQIRALTGGDHVIQVGVHAGARLVNFVRLQVLVQYPIDTSALTEAPVDNNTNIPSSLIAFGPSVYIPGCEEVVDAAGRMIDCEIQGDRVVLSSLPTGTYFAKRGEKRVTKIVKLN